MSGNNSNGGSALFFPRNPRNARAAIVRSSEIKRKPRIISVLVNDGYVLSTAPLQKLARFDLGESWITCFDCKKETVVRCPAESGPVEHRLVPPRQPIHDLPGEERGKRGKKHGELEHDRKEGRYCAPSVRFPVNNERIDE